MQADLLDVLTRLASASNIRCMRVTPPFDGLDQFDYGLRKALDPYFDWQEFGSLLLQSTPPNTLLFAEGTFELQFVAVCAVPHSRRRKRCVHDRPVGHRRAQRKIPQLGTPSHW